MGARGRFYINRQGRKEREGRVGWRLIGERRVSAPTLKLRRVNFWLRGSQGWRSGFARVLARTVCWGAGEKAPSERSLHLVWCLSSCRHLAFGLGGRGRWLGEAGGVCWAVNAGAVVCSMKNEQNMNRAAGGVGVDRRTEGDRRPEAGGRRSVDRRAVDGGPEGGVDRRAVDRKPEGGVDRRTVDRRAWTGSRRAVDRRAVDGGPEGGVDRRTVDGGRSGPEAGGRSGPEDGGPEGGGRGPEAGGRRAEWTGGRWTEGGGRWTGSRRAVGGGMRNGRLGAEGFVTVDHRSELATDGSGALYQPGFVFLR